MYDKYSTEINVTDIGTAAQARLAAMSKWSVTGITRNGIFLNAAPERVIFLSTERSRGPLTLNLGSLPGEITPHQAASFDGEYLHIGEARLSIKTAAPWFSPPPADPPAPGYRERFAAALSKYHNRRPGGLPAELLGELASGASRHPMEGVIPGLARLSRALKSLQPEAIAASLEGFYGLGTGLTPSGDDLILGLLLSLNRWGRQLYPGLNIPAINRAAVAAASCKTTALSASLIACASQRQADERLVFALDGLATGAVAPEGCVEALLAWGNSSGGDALAGMAVAITNASSSAGTPYPDRVK